MARQRAKGTPGDRGKENGPQVQDEAGAPPPAPTPEEAKARLADTGRNDPCPCGSAKKYKRCHLQADETAAAPPVGPPNVQAMLASGWRLFEQRRPGAAEREFRAALALDPGLSDARVGIGMARLSSGDTDGALQELSLAVAAGEAPAAELRRQGVKDAFTKPEAQAYIRASHALGCLAYDQERFDEALTALERVYTIDEGTVGIEARLVAGKTYMKLDRPLESVSVVEPITGSEAGGSRARMGLALAHFAAGQADDARMALGEALDANPHFGKAILGKLRKRVEAAGAAVPGSLEEAALYAQTYGDVWTDAAKKFVEEVLGQRSAHRVAAIAAPPGSAAP